MRIPETDDLEGTPIDPAVAEQFRTSFGLDAAPTTLADWAERSADVLAAGIQAIDRPLTTTDSSCHTVELDAGSYHATGLVEALVLAFRRGSNTDVLVRSESPLDDATVGLRVSGETIAASPPEAVISFGVARNVVAPAYFSVPPHIAYRRFSQYVNAFPGNDAYHTWARRTDGVRSMALSIPDGVAAIRAIADRLDELPDDRSPART